MKTASAGLIAHLAQEAKSLATCIRIERLDGLVFAFTDHDKPLTVGGELYESRQGYDRTAIESSASFEVDNMDLEGWFEAGAIEEKDLRNGLFDSAEVTIFVVNHQDLASGTITLKTGWLGEQSLFPSGKFKAEFRGLTQALTQNVGKVYQPECRASLGDGKCKFPVQPDIIARETAYALGAFVRVPVVALVATDDGLTSAALVVSYPGFGYTGQLYEWGNWVIVNARQVAPGFLYDLAAYRDTYYATGVNGTASFSLTQTIELTTAANYDAGAIDAGRGMIGALVHSAQDTYDIADYGRIIFEALDATGTSLATLYDSGNYTPRHMAWEEFGVSAVSIPALTRKLRISLNGYRGNGAQANVLFDGVSAELLVLSDAPVEAAQNAFGNLIYEVLAPGATAASQPTYSGVLGETVTDGTAQLRAREAFTRTFFIQEVFSPYSFRIISDTSALDPGFFDFGALRIETGEAAGTVLEVKTWGYTTGIITTYLPFDASRIVAGVRGFVYAGCNRQLNTCISKFQIGGSLDFSAGNSKNYRGEPYLPGRDFLGQYPGAK
jgi:hypothetical protein